MEEMVIVAGFGGQGVQLIGKMLVEAGMQEGKEVSFLPSYGAEMRGGTSNCNVIISDEPVCSPIVNEATCVMALNRPSLDKFEGAVLPGKTLLVNSSLVDRKAARTDIEVAHAVTVDTVMDNLKEMFGERKAHLLPINRQAIEKGMESVREQRA